MQRTNLDLGVIGNGSFGALIDRDARVVWSCLPAFDGDPAFCALLSPRGHEGGDFAIELEDYAGSEQHYITNTAILRTVLRDLGGDPDSASDLPQMRDLAGMGRFLQRLRNAGLQLRLMGEIAHHGIKLRRRTFVDFLRVIHAQHHLVREPVGKNIHDAAEKQRHHHS